MSAAQLQVCISGALFLHHVHHLNLECVTLVLVNRASHWRACAIIPMEHRMTCHMVLSILVPNPQLGASPSFKNVRKYNINIFDELLPIVRISWDDLSVSVFSTLILVCRVQMGSSRFYIFVHGALMFICYWHKSIIDNF